MREWGGEERGEWGSRFRKKWEGRVGEKERGTKGKGSAEVTEERVSEPTLNFFFRAKHIMPTYFNKGLPSYIF
jgi:hypothetical protein